jgi:hypothetical protein
MRLQRKLHGRNFEGNCCVCSSKTNTNMKRMRVVITL